MMQVKKIISSISLVLAITTFSFAVSAADQAEQGIAVSEDTPATLNAAEIGLDSENSTIGSDSKNSDSYQDNGEDEDDSGGGSSETGGRSSTTGGMSSETGGSSSNTGGRSIGGIGDDNDESDDEPYDTQQPSR